MKLIISTLKNRVIESYKCTKPELDYETIISEPINECKPKKFDWKKNEDDDGVRYKVDCEITYECVNETYTLEGEKTGVCSDDGDWGSVRRCCK